MNRRELLKFTLLAPLVGLFKSRKSGASTGLTKNKAMRRCPGLEYPVETSGTSSDTTLTHWVILSGNNFNDEPELYTLEDGEPIEATKALFDPNSHWAKAMAKEGNKIVDDVIIKPFSQ